MRFICLMLTALLALTTAAHAQQGNNGGKEDRRTHLMLIPERTQVSGGETLTVVIEQTIDRGWHTYWHNPGDSGEGMKITWNLPEGFSAGELQFPAPSRIPVGPLMSYGYEGRATFLQEIKLPETLPEGPIGISARIFLLVCADICIPEQETLGFTLNGTRDVGNPDAIARARASLPAPYDGAGTWSFRENNGNLEFMLQGENAAKLAGLQENPTILILPYAWGLIDNSASPFIASGKNSFSFRQARGTEPLDDLGEIKAMLTFRDESGGLRGEIITASSNGGAVFTPAPGIEVPAAKADIGFLAAIGFALMGGLILNLMPCVFPVLSMKALSLVKMAERGHLHARIYGLTYTAGILTCFLAIAGALILLQAGGAQIGWGFQLQNPGIVLGLAILLFILGLNLSGLFEISGAFTNVGAGLAGREGLRGSFFTGMLAAIVATPCTAPFMGVALGYAITQNAAIALAVFAALGLGLALPFLILSFVPALQQRLPKPGHWMQTLREALAFPMYASAAWLIWVYGMQTGSAGALYGMLILITIAFALWLAGKGKKAKIAAILILLGLFACAIICPRVHGGKDAAAVGKHAAAEEAYSAASLAALLEGPRPVFVNMTADWCITCKVNERVALANSSVREAFAQQDIAYLKGDWTNEDPEITKYLAQHGRNGVPLYVFYGKPDGSGQRPAPVVLPQILTPGLVRDTVTTP